MLDSLPTCHKHVSWAVIHACCTSTRGPRFESQEQHFSFSFLGSVLKNSDFEILRWLRTIHVWLHPKNSNTCHESTIIDNHFKIIRIHKTFFSSKPDCSTMRETRVRNPGLLKECRMLGHPYAAGFSTKHYLPDKLRGSTFSFSITMLVFKKQLFQFTIRSFTQLPLLSKSSNKKISKHSFVA